MAVELTRFIAIAGGGWTAAQRQEWQNAVLDELIDLPYMLVMPALKEARRKIEFPGKLVVWVYGQIEDRLNRLRVEQSNYERLIGIAGEA